MIIINDRYDQTQKPKVKSTLGREFMELQVRRNKNGFIEMVNIMHQALVQHTLYAGDGFLTDDVGKAEVCVINDSIRFELHNVGVSIVEEGSSRRAVFHRYGYHAESIIMNNPHIVDKDICANPWLEYSDSDDAFSDHNRISHWNHFAARRDSLHYGGKSVAFVSSNDIQDGKHHIIEIKIKHVTDETTASYFIVTNDNTYCFVRTTNAANTIPLYKIVKPKLLLSIKLKETIDRMIDDHIRHYYEQS